MRNWDNDYFNDEQFVEILNEYEQSLEQGSASYLDADDLTDIADYYCTKQQIHKAWQAIEQALEQFPDALSPKIFVIRDHIFNGEWEKARAEFDKSGHSIDEDVELLYIQAELLIHDNQIAKADHLLTCHIPTDDTEGETRNYIREVIDVYLDYYTPDADTYITQWAERLRTMPELNFNDNMTLADVWSTLGQYDKAIQMLQDMLNEHPFKHQAWILMAETHEKAEHYAEAIDAAKFALAICPDCFDAMLALERNTWLLAKPFNEWKQTAVELLRHFPHSQEALCAVASRYLQHFINSNSLDDLMEARKLLEQALKHNHGNQADTSSILINLAYTYAAQYTYIAITDETDKYTPTTETERMLKECHDTCMSYIEQAHDISTETTDKCRVDIAGIYISIDELWLARPYLQLELKEHPDNAQAHNSLGLLSLDLQLYPLAIQHIQTAAALDPDTFLDNSHAPLSFCYYSMGQKALCLQHLAIACNITPKYAAEFFANIYPHVDPSQYHLYV